MGADSTRLDIPVAEGIPVGSLKANPQDTPGPLGSDGLASAPPDSNGVTPVPPGSVGVVPVPGIIPIDQDTVLEQQVLVLNNEN